MDGKAIDRKTMANVFKGELYRNYYRRSRNCEMLFA